MDYFMYIASYEYAFAHFQKKTKYVPLRNVVR